MTIEQMQKRLAELQELAKQHESILLQISGAIQEYNRVIAEEQSKAMTEGAKMPLTKSPSKQAFEKNIKAEIKAGKPPKQAVAIAYSVKREAKPPKGKK